MTLFNLTTKTELAVSDTVAPNLLSKGGWRPSLPLPVGDGVTKPSPLPSGTSASKLYAKASELEGKLDQLRGAVVSAEEALASAYAEGDDTNSATRRLMESRDQLSAAIAALKNLEAQAFERAKAERKHAEQVILADMTAELVKHRAKIKSALAAALPADMRDIVEELSRTADMRLWGIIQEKAGLRYTELPKVPAPPLPRDNAGRPMDEAAQLEAARKAGA